MAQHGFRMATDHDPRQRVILPGGSKHLGEGGFRRATVPDRRIAARLIDHQHIACGGRG